MTALVCSRCGESARAFAEHGDEITCGGETARVVTLKEYSAMVECDCCGKHFPPDEVEHIPADRAGAAQCDTTACEACRSGS